MTDEELIARLRDFATREASAMPPGWPDAHGLYSDAADRIAALSEQLAAARRDAEEAEAYAGELESNGLANRVAIMRLKAKLATCEKYRDAYAEMERIATDALRKSEARAEAAEAKVAKLVEAAKEVTRHDLFRYETRRAIDDLRAAIAEVQINRTTTPTEYERKVAQMKEDFPNGI